MDASLSRNFQGTDAQVVPDLAFKLKKKLEFSYTNLYLTFHGGIEMMEVGVNRAFRSLKNVMHQLLPSSDDGQEASDLLHQRRSMAGKTCIVTGANAGLGLITATELVKRGAHVLLACRSLERGQAAKSVIEKTLEGIACEGTAEVYSLDLSSFESVKKFADEIKYRNKTINVLINNAGIMTPPNRILTKNGFESQFQVNYLSHFFLTQYLLPKSSNSTPSSNSYPRNEGMRIINITSLMHFGGKINFDDINFDHVYHPLSAYAQSKLALVLMSKELQKRRNDVVSVSVHPGIIDTDLAWNYFNGAVPGFLMPIMRKTISSCLLTPQEALDSVLYAIDEEPQIISSKYVADGRIKSSSPLSNNEKLSSRLWEHSIAVFNQFNSKHD